MNESELKEEKVFGELIYDGVVLKVAKDRVLLPNGKEAVREYCLHVGAVCILPITDDGNVIMERQYRYPHGRVFFEIPAGKLDSPDEDPMKAAARELREETGAIAGKLTYLGRIDTTPAIINEKIHLFLAEELSWASKKLDEDEFLFVEEIPFAKLYDMVLSGNVADAKTQIAVLKAAALMPHLINK